VSLKSLEAHGLCNWFPELAKVSTHEMTMFGHPLRTKIFLEPVAPLDFHELYRYTSGTIGSLFKDLAFPVTTALFVFDREAGVTGETRLRRPGDTPSPFKKS
jgi:hypothetical protein